MHSRILKKYLCREFNLLLTGNDEGGKKQRLRQHPPPQLKGETTERGKRETTARRRRYFPNEGEPCKRNKRNIPAELARVPLENRANTRSRRTDKPSWRTRSNWLSFSTGSGVPYFFFLFVRPPINLRILSRQAVLSVTAAFFSRALELALRDTLVLWKNINIKGDEKCYSNIIRGTLFDVT